MFLYDFSRFIYCGCENWRDRGSCLYWLDSSKHWYLWRLQLYFSLFCLDSHRCDGMRAFLEREREMESERIKKYQEKEKERVQKLSQLWILKWLHVSHVFWLSSMLQDRVTSAQLHESNQVQERTCISHVGHGIYFVVLFSYLLFFKCQICTM